MKRTPVKKVNGKRRASEFQRCYGSKARVAWVKAQPCWICATTPCENAHVRNGGMGRKAGAEWVIPLCRPCHATLHRIGIRSFEARYEGVDLEFSAIRIATAWNAETAHQNTLRPAP